MYNTKCPVCGSTRVQKNGRRNGVQLYICASCRYQFRNVRQPSNDKIWEAYMTEKQTIGELAKRFFTSESTVKRRLKEVAMVWRQPPLEGGGYVHIDATYWGRNWGILAAIDEERGYPLYMAFIRNETASDYMKAVSSIVDRGYKIQGIIIDGKQCLFQMLSGYKVQMCQFHMKQIVRRYLTLHPKLMAARALKDLVAGLPSAGKDEFYRKYAQWKTDWSETLNKKSKLKSGKCRYTHSRLRSAVHSIDFFLPYLFTYQEIGCEGMPNTNNKIEGLFTNLKRKLNSHSGMSGENRERFISGFFLALEEKLR